MPYKRFIRTVTLLGPGLTPTRPDEFRCGYEYPEVYTIEAGNPPGSSVFDVRWELAPGETGLPLEFLPPSVDLADDTHVSLACQCNNDASTARVKIRIVSLAEVCAARSPGEAVAPPRWRS
jgi:hypothetical protein